MFVADRDLIERARDELNNRRRSLYQNIWMKQSLTNDIQLLLTLDAALADEASSVALIDELEQDRVGLVAWLSAKVALSLWQKRSYEQIVERLGERLRRQLAVKESDDLLSAATGNPGFRFPFAQGALYEALLATKHYGDAGALADRMLDRCPRADVYIALMKHAARGGAADEVSRLLNRSKQLRPPDQAKVAKAKNELRVESREGPSGDGGARGGPPP